MNRYHHRNDFSARPLFKPGTVVYAKADAETRLAVMRYAQGIYYCAVIGDAENNNLPFLESQLQVAREGG